MKYEIWTKAMEEISDRHIVEAAKIQKKRRRPLWLGLTAAAAVAAIVLGVVLWPGGSPLVPTVQAVSQAEYPASAPYREDSLFSEQHLPRPSWGVAAFTVGKPTDNIGVFIQLEWAFGHKLVQTFL